MSSHRPDEHVPWWRQLLHALTDTGPRYRIVDLPGQTTGLVLFIVLTPALVAVGSDAAGQAWPLWVRVLLIAWSIVGVVLVAFYLRRPARK